MIINPYAFGGSLDGLGFDGASYLELDGANWGSYTRSKWAFACEFRVTGDTGGDQRILSYTQSGGEFLIHVNRLSATTFDIEHRCVQEGGAGSTVYNSGFTGNVGDLVSMLLHFEADGVNFGVDMWVNGASDTPDISTGGTNAPQALSGDITIGATKGGTNYFKGVIRQPTFFDNALPSTGDIFDGTRLKDDLSGVTGAYSLLDASTPTYDVIKELDWVNVGSVTN